MPNVNFLKPRSGLAVWLPARGRYVLPEGETVTVDAYVERRIVDGDLLVETPKKTLSKTLTKKTEVEHVDSVPADSGK